MFSLINGSKVLWRRMTFLVCKKTPYRQHWMYVYTHIMYIYSHIAYLYNISCLISYMCISLSFSLTSISWRFLHISPSDFFLGCLFILFYWIKLLYKILLSSCEQHNDALYTHIYSFSDCFQVIRKYWVEFCAVGSLSVVILHTVVCVLIPVS